MSDEVLFCMWGAYRKSVIGSHNFYVEQAQKRLLSQFDDIENEAENAANEWLEKNKNYFDPERHEPGDFYDRANDAGIEFYQLLTEMREQTILSVVAGMFHEWEKQLRKWLTDEIRHWHSGNKVKEMTWKVNFREIIDFLECLGWNVRNRSYFSILDKCRLVVNVYKHGDGSSLSVLKRDHPEYFDNPLVSFGKDFSDIDFIDYTRLSVSHEQLSEFAEAIVEFWQDVPEYIYDREDIVVPVWFEKAMSDDAIANDK